MNSSTKKNLNFLFVILVVALILVAVCYVVLSDRGNKTQSVTSDLSTKTSMMLGESVFYKTENTINNYIMFDMSPNDTFEVAFYKGKKSNKIVVNSGTWAKTTNANGSKTILHLIPQYILKKGYNKISITPIRGDGDYYVSNLQTITVDDVDASTYINFNIIDFEIKQYEIEIDDESYQKILVNRQVALELDFLHTTDDSLVPAKIKADGETYKTDIRLKGDNTDHLQGDQWSYRVGVKGDFAIYGLQRFSLQPIATRNGIWEYMIYEMYREQGGVALRYDFADVHVNGIYLGVFAVEEFMEKRILENSLQREGPIIRKNENPMFTRWSYYDDIVDPYQIYRPSFAHYSPLQEHFRDYLTFSEKKTTQSVNLNGYAQYAITMMNKYFHENEPIENVFDVDKYLKLYSILDLFSSNHGRIENNMRHYYNPITGLLEPIPFDEIANHIDLFTINNYKWMLIARKMLENYEYKKLLLQYTTEFATDYPNFIKRHKNRIDNYILTLQRDYSNFTMDVWLINNKIEQIKSLNNLIELKASIIYNNETSSYELIIQNDKFLVAEISGIIQNDENLIKYCIFKDNQFGSFKDNILTVNRGQTITVNIPLYKVIDPDNLSIVWQKGFLPKQTTAIIRMERSLNNE